jgi:hypothetical protein
MMLAFVRVPLTVLFAYTLVKATLRYPEINGGDMIFLLGYALAGSVIVAILWAPVIGDKLSDPLTSSLSSETSLPPNTNQLVQSIRWLQRRGWHRPALFLVFMEGLRHPTLPQPALLGLRSVKPGSFLEKCFAKEVFRYSNIQNCLHAYKILTERHGMTPRQHPQPEVNLAISNLTRERPPEPAKYKVVTAATKPAAERNPRIKLFEE